MDNEQEVVLFEVDNLRAIITGKMKFSKCPFCNEKGRVFSVDDENYYPEPKPEWGCNYVDDYCDNCDGLGYVQE